MTERARSLRDDELRARLSAVGLRATGWRMVILRELAKRRTPTSHPELAQCLCKLGLDRTTVYRNLLALTRAGLLVKTQLADRVSRFELPRTQSLHHHRHPHFVCSDCGDIACLPVDSVALSGVAAQNQVSEVQLWGRCARCARQQRVDPSTAPTARTGAASPTSPTRRSA